MLFQALNPATGETLPGDFHDATPSEIDAALTAAAGVADAFRQAPPALRAALLRAIADQIEALGQPLLDRARLETALPLPRLEGERARTTGQARAFADLVEAGHWVDARIDRAQPARQPLPKPDVRSMLRPLGPAVVFGASNFPLAISVAGADTIAALGAGCPVVVKAHPAHPGTSDLVAGAIRKALAGTGLPAAVFHLVHGASHETGAALVRHPATKVVAFTGSLAGGRALADLAAARPGPIPFYGELGSINPVFLLPGALAERAPALAEGFAGSLSLGVGQFCTNPGLVLAPESPGLDAFRSAAAEAIAAIAPATMLHAGIHAAYQSGCSRLAETTQAGPAARSAAEADPAKSQAPCLLFETDAATLLATPSLQEEIFGPASTLVRCRGKQDLLDFAEQLEGSLTATVHGTGEDLAGHADLLAILERKAGRLIVNGFPTGIEVCPSMHHGGPYPASTHSHFTSIGTRTILKFTRPVCYQGFPQNALPPELQDANPLQIRRLLDGEPE